MWTVNYIIIALVALLAMWQEIKGKGSFYVKMAKLFSGKEVSFVRKRQMVAVVASYTALVLLCIYGAVFSLDAVPFVLITVLIIAIYISVLFLFAREK